MLAVAEPLILYHFSRELRKPTVKIAATDEINAIVCFNRLMGMPPGSIVYAKAKVEFDPRKHLPEAIIADPDVEALEQYPPVLLPKFRPSDRTKYGNADPMEFPLLQHFGRATIQPEWIMDRRTGKPAIAGEFESFPKYFLDLSERPTADELFAAGGRINIGGGFDTLARHLNEAEPWLRLEDGEDLRQRLLNEIDRYERKYL